MTFATKPGKNGASQLPNFPAARPVPSCQVRAINRPGSSRTRDAPAQLRLWDKQGVTKLPNHNKYETGSTMVRT